MICHNEVSNRSICRSICVSNFQFPRNFGLYTSDQKNPKAFLYTVIDDINQENAKGIAGLIKQEARRFCMQTQGTTHSTLGLDEINNIITPIRVTKDFVRHIVEVSQIAIITKFDGNKFQIEPSHSKCLMSSPFIVDLNQRRIESPSTSNTVDEDSSKPSMSDSWQTSFPDIEKRWQNPEKPSTVEKDLSCSSDSDDDDFNTVETDVYAPSPASPVRKRFKYTPKKPLSNPSKKTEQVEPMPSTSRDDPSPSTSQVDKVISVKEHLDSSHPNVPYTDIARQLEYFRVVASNLSGYAEWMESQFVNYLRENHLDAMKGNASSLSFPFQIQDASKKIKRPRGRPKKLNDYRIRYILRVIVI